MKRQHLQAVRKVAVFDFDGTISTLRAGWETVMAPFMLEMIAGSRVISAGERRALQEEIDDYIDQSTGIQTIYQMRWLREQVLTRGWNSEVADEWSYKSEYNRRLLEQVRMRTAQVRSGQHPKEHYLMKGSVALLQALYDAGVEMHLASGTDHPDVVSEAELLGVASYFRQIVGAPPHKAECSKEKVIAELLHTHAGTGVALYVIGDGKVEIGLGRTFGGLSFGVASDEWYREGINRVKQERLLQAGAHWIAGDFLDLQQWLEKFGLHKEEQL